MANGLDKWEHFFSEEDKGKALPRAMHVLIVIPMVVETGETFSAHLTALRADGYPALDFEGAVVLKYLGNEIAGLPETVEFDKEDRGIKQVHGLKIEEEGFSWIKLGSAVKGTLNIISGFSNPVRTQKKVDYRIYWGDLHVHSSCGHCHEHIFKSPDYGYWFGRYVMGLDYAAMADHANQMSRDKGEWEKVVKAAKEHHEPGEFVTFLGFETDYQPLDGGHFNIYFNDDDGPLKSFKYDDFTVTDIFDFTKENNSLAISHHNARGVRGRDFSQSCFGEGAEPVVEVYSKWGSSEAPDGWRPVKGGTENPCHYYREALRRGYKLGVIGGTDDHNTCPASYMIMPPYEKPFYAQPGIGAIIAEKKERDSMFKAIKSRRAYAASNNRFYADFRIDGQVMGTEIQSKKPNIKLTLAARENFRFVEIYKNAELFFRTSGKEIIDLELEDKNLDRESSYFVRAETDDNERCWLSPIWVTP